jgi:hypothetical protein
MASSALGGGRLTRFSMLSIPTRDAGADCEEDPGYSHLHPFLFRSGGSNSDTVCHGTETVQRCE